MGEEAYYWRADGGSQPVPNNTTPSASSSTPDPPQPPVEMMCFPAYGPWMCQPTSWLQAPVPLAGLCTPPPPYAPPALQQPCCQPPPPPPPPVDEVKAKKEKQEEKKKEKATNPYAPPKLEKGTNYMFDRQNTMLHIFCKAAPIWTEKYRGVHLKFKRFVVSTTFTVKMVIENTLNKTGDDCNGWAATEVAERGSGSWDKGTTIEYQSDKASGSLKSMGWSEKRGNSLPPVWLVVHKADVA